MEVKWSTKKAQTTRYLFSAGFTPCGPVVKREGGAYVSGLMGGDALHEFFYFSVRIMNEYRNLNWLKMSALYFCTNRT